MLVKALVQEVVNQVAKLEKWDLDWLALLGSQWPG